MLTPRRFISRIGLWITIAVFGWPILLNGQTYSGSGNSHEVFVGTETESYLRYLDLTDTTSSASWMIRPLSTTQLRRLSSVLVGQPWLTRLRGFAAATSPTEVGLLSPNVSLRFNSSFPYGSNDAAVWAGRGATVAVQAGVYARFGPVSLTLAPLAFSAQNTSFPLAPSSLPCGCGDPVLGGSVDKPQRFGTTSYARLDPGQSSLAIDIFNINAGFSTANEGWGPQVEYPFILGNNAAGFPHFFFGSSSPFSIFIGKAHLKVLYGRLDQTSFSPVNGSKFYFSNLEPGRVRFASGLVASFQPRGVDGLEIGGARFVHSVWPRSGIPSSYLKKPFQAFLKVNTPGVDAQLAGTDNQVAELFARWAFRPSGLEVYAEYGREDNSYDFRDFAQEPDHSRSYSLGLAKTIGRHPSGFDVFRVELINFQLPALATTGRGEGGIYIHGFLRQGHTNRGQLLGADAGVGAAAASTVRWDRYSTSGRWGFYWRRNVRQETSDPTLKNPDVTQISDVLHAFGFERLAFTRHFDITTSLVFMRDLSRNFSSSQSNLNAVASITLPR